MGRPGFDAPRAGRGAHARPDNPVRPSYEDRPYDGGRSHPEAGGYGRSDTRIPGYIDRRSDQYDPYPPRQRPRPPAGSTSYPTSAPSRTAYPSSAYPASGPAYPTSSPAYQMSAPAHHGARATSYAGAGGYAPSTYYEPERDHTGSAPATPAWDGHPSLDPRQVPPYRPGEFTDGHGRRVQSDLLTRSAEQRIYQPPPHNGPAIGGLVFGFTPLSPLAIALGIVGLVRSHALKVGRGMAVAAIILGLAWAPVDYLAYRHFSGSPAKSSSSAHQPNPAPSGASPSSIPDAGCTLAENSANSFNKALQTDSNSPSKLITDFKNAAAAFNSAAAKESDPVAATAMRKFGADLQSIYTSLSKHQTPSATVMNRLGTDANAVDNACGD